jgi:hypothetical protein
LTRDAFPDGPAAARPIRAVRCGYHVQDVNVNRRTLEIRGGKALTYKRT